MRLAQRGGRWASPVTRLNHVVRGATDRSWETTFPFDSFRPIRSQHCSLQSPFISVSFNTPRLELASRKLLHNLYQQESSENWLACTAAKGLPKGIDLCLLVSCIRRNFSLQASSRNSEPRIRQDIAGLFLSNCVAPSLSTDSSASGIARRQETSESLRCLPDPKPVYRCKSLKRPPGWNVDEMSGGHLGHFSRQHIEVSV